MRFFEDLMKALQTLNEFKITFFFVVFHLPRLTMGYYCFRAEDYPNNLYNCRANKVV